MKNFRKVLALILVVATLFSFAAMIGAREVGDYTDYDKVSYQEAVDVLTAIGILDGYTDGSFKPTDSIAREEMAKMVAVLSNAGDDVSELYASACKFADTKDRWSASYVAYCNETGIVAGRNATTFDPRGNVTGLETAKMLLCLIGFDATAQGYVGSNWKTNVLSDAKNIGLLAGFAADYDISKAITREEAAQMMLNALKAPMVVGTLSNNIVTISNNVWLSRYGFKVAFDLTLNDAEKKYDLFVLYGNVVVSNIPVLTNYKGLSVDEGQDCYGNPVTEWVYENSKGVKIWSAQYATTPDYTATVAVDLGSVLDDEINSNRFDYKISIYVDGEILTAGNVKWSNASIKTNVTALKNIDGEITGKGVLTNVYVDDVDHEIIVTVKNTFIGEVEATTYGGSKFSLVDNLNGYGLTSFVFDNSEYGFESGDIILYWVCSKDGKYEDGKRVLHDAKVVEPVVVDVERVTYKETALSSTTAVAISDAGKSYEYAENLFVEMAGPDGVDIITQVTGSAKGNSVYNTYDLYLDEYGYIMAWYETNDSDEQAVAYYIPGSLEGVATSLKSGVQHYTFTADFVTMDGTTTEVTLEDTTRFGETYRALRDADEDRDGYGALLTYATNKDGEVYVSEIAGEENGAFGGPDYFASGVTEQLYLSQEGDLMVKGTDTVFMSGTSSTKYLVKTGDTYTAYSYWNLPGDLWSSEEGFGWDWSFAIQYFYHEVTGGDLLSYVFIDAKYTMEDTLAFIGKYVKTVSDEEFADEVENKNYRLYEAVVDGTVSYLAVDDSYAGAWTLHLGDEFLVVRANLKYMGVSDSGEIEGNLPIYTLVTYEEPTLVGALNDHILVSEDLSFVSVTDGTAIAGLRTYKLTEDTVIAVATGTFESQFNWSSAKLEVIDAAELDNYAGDFNSTDLNGYKYDLDFAWLFTDGNEVTHLFISTNAAETDFNGGTRNN